ncbi:MAG: hypothetical protein Q9166_006986 [cf. Caloplaca sp. 2 TL-2023]
MRDSLGLNVISASTGLIGETGELGNLADELTEAWGEDGGGNYQSGNAVGEDGADGPPNGDSAHGWPTLEIHHDGGISMPKISHNIINDNRSLSPSKQPARSRNHRTVSHASDYDGSDYGDNSALEDVKGVSASLEHRLAFIESLARRGTESNGSGADTVTLRVLDALRDLSSQAGVETGASRYGPFYNYNPQNLAFSSRLTIAHTAVTSNLAHQTRLVQTLSHNIVSPFSIPLDLDAIDDLLPSIAVTSEFLPPPSLRAVSALHSLHYSASELISTLATLADSLHMIRQTTSLASRKLKAAKEAVDELRREAGIREEGIRWVERGNWDHRISNRECATICGDLVDGFREICEQWEKTIGDDVANSGTPEVAAG